MTHTTYTIDSAPEAAKDVLRGAKQAYGFVPNLLGVMAGAPALLKAYTALSRLFDETSLGAAERQVVLLTVSYENGCEYCVAAHSVVADMQKVPADVVSAIREHRPIGDPDLEALRRFTATVVRHRGRPTKADVQMFLAAGYKEPQVLEVILGVGMKTLSNYTNNIADTPLDEAFARATWSKAA